MSRLTRTTGVSWPPARMEAARARARTPAVRSRKRGAVGMGLPGWSPLILDPGRERPASRAPL